MSDTDKKGYQFARLLYLTREASSQTTAVDEEQSIVEAEKIIQELLKNDISLNTYKLKNNNLKEYLQFIDTDFVKTQLYSIKTFINLTEVYIYAYFFSDIRNIMVNPLLYLIFSDPEVKTLINTKLIIPTNYGLWRLLTESKKIKIPDGFISPGSIDVINYENIVEKKNTSLYYYLFRDVLLNRKIINKDDRCFIKNINKIIFNKYENIDLTIVIPIYGAMELLNQTLVSLYRANIKNYEIICIDDCGPTNSSYDYSVYENIVVLRNKQNIGFSNSCNHGVKHAKGKYVLLLNSDTVVCKNAIENAIEKLKTESNTAIVGSKLINLDGTLQEAGGIIWSNANVINFMRGKNNYTSYSEFDRIADYVSGAALFFKKEIWIKLGGFDKQFTPAYYEDTDICVRAKSKGYKVVYCHDSEIIHAEGGTNGTDIRVGIKSYQEKNKNKFRLLWKTYISKNFAPDGKELKALASGRKIVFFIDHYVPKNASDAGSKATIHLVDELISRNYFVIFWPDNLYPDDINRSYLAKKGVLTLYGQGYINKFKNIVESVEKEIEKIFLSRPHISIKYINQINKELMKKTVYIGHDIHYERMNLEQKLKNNILLFNTDTKEISEVRRQEIFLWKTCAKIAYFTQRETNIVNYITQKNNAVTIPLFKQKKLIKVNSNQKQRNGFLFVGGFDHQPNRDGLLWLIKGLKQNKIKFDNTIKIVGSKIPDDIKDILNKNDIIYYENISNDDLDIIYMNSKIVIAPLRYGSGFKGKVLEAIEKEIPVITTSIGYQGFEILDPIKSYDNVIDFINQMHLLDKNNAVCDKVKRAQSSMLEQYFVTANYKNIFKE